MALDVANSQNSLTFKTLDRLLEDAQIEGKLYLTGKKFKELPKAVNKYNLQDTVFADLSWNHFAELPHIICNLLSLEYLNCSHNVIKSIPTEICNLQFLTALDLSRNHISQIPESLCQLKSLQTLLLSSNRLVTIPEELSNLENLQELDVSCNRITCIPVDLRDLHSLKVLILRQNLILELPIELCHLRLRILDVSGNKLEILPYQYQIMDSLEVLNLHHNPLVSPPANLINRGLEHIMKFLLVEAKKANRCSSNPQQNGAFFQDQTNNFRSNHLSKVSPITNSSFLGNIDASKKRTPLFLNSNFASEASANYNDSFNRYTAAHSRREQCSSAAAEENGQSRGLSSRGSSGSLSKAGSLSETPRNINFYRDRINSDVTPANNSLLTSRLNYHSHYDNTYGSSNAYRSDDHRNHMPRTSSLTASANHSFLGGFPVIQLAGAHKGDTSSTLSKQQFEPPSDKDPDRVPYDSNSSSSTPQPNEDLIEEMRNTFEQRLKIRLPADMASTLRDGVILCHLANKLRPRAVPSVHVPSPGQAVLGLPKCRRNLENFLEACRREGIPESQLFSIYEVIDCTPTSTCRIAKAVIALATASSRHTTSGESHTNTGNNSFDRSQTKAQSRPLASLSERYSHINGSMYGDIRSRNVTMPLTETDTEV